MTPLRLVVLGVLFYIGWLLLKGMLKEKLTGSGTDKNKDNDLNNKVEDVLVEDPVCHKLVPKRQAIRLRYNDDYVYFCSEKCCDSFAGEPGGEK